MAALHYLFLFGYLSSIAVAQAPPPSVIGQRNPTARKSTATEEVTVKNPGVPIATVSGPPAADNVKPTESVPDVTTAASDYTPLGQTGAGVTLEGAWNTLVQKAQPEPAPVAQPDPFSLFGPPLNNLFVKLWSPDDTVQYDVLPARYDRIKRQAAHDHARDHGPPKVTKPKHKRIAKKNVPMDTVHKNHKQLISVDPAAFSSMLMGVFDAWYEQRFGLKEKTNIKVIAATTKQTTPKPTTTQVVQKKKDGINKKALFKEFLALAMDYFKPKDNKASKVVKQKISAKKVTKKKAKVKKTSVKKKVKARQQVAETATRRKVTGAPRIITHPPVLTRQSDTGSPPAERTDASETRAATRNNGGGEGRASKQKTKDSASSAGKKASKKKKSKASKKKRPRNKGPRIDPEFLSDINEVRVMQGLPELTADQVDVYGNILPETPPSDSSSHDHGHSHSHSHSHDHGFGHGHSSLDYGHGFGYGAEAHIQSTLHDTHRRAHAMAGPLSDPMHRELHRLLRNREIDLRREAWERRRYGSNLYGGSPVLQSVVDPDALRELVNSEISAGPMENGGIGR